MKNFVRNGNKLPYANATGATITSGTLVIVGALAGVAETDIADQTTGTLNLKGVFSLPKANGAVSQAAKLYYDATNKVLTTTASGNTLCAVAADAALAGDANVNAALTNGV